MTVTPNTPGEKARSKKPRRFFFGPVLDRMVLTLAVLLIIIFFLPRFVAVIRSGQAGVVWQSYSGGTDVRRILGEGIHLVGPWDKVYIYNVRLQEVTRTYEVLSRDGLHLQVTASARFRPKGAPFPWTQSTPNALAQLHKYIGPQYVNVLLVPDVSSVLRRVIQKYSGDQIFSERGLFEQQAFATARQELNARYVDLDALLIEKIDFPAAVRAAIEGKLMEEQAVLRYEYILARERQEAERKRIEAVGVRDFQRTVGDGLTDQYLRWKAIEAMVLISRSENSKLIIIGGKDGIPIVLSPDGTAATPRTPALKPEPP
jgi:regulator of protease activity HflC (stomatin/prohibitin superfamily)